MIKLSSSPSLVNVEQNDNLMEAVSKEGLKDAIEFSF